MMNRRSNARSGTAYRRGNLRPPARRNQETIVCICYNAKPCTYDFRNKSGGRDGAPPLQNVVRRFKTYTAKAYVEISNSANAALWQRSFYEHIIRDEQDYNEIWGYIKMG
jgi:hypothetical protein